MSKTSIVFVPAGDATDAFARQVAERIPQFTSGVSFGPCAAFAVIRNEKVAAGIILHDWQPDWRTIEISAASFGGLWAAPEVFRALGDYLFNHLGIYKVFTKTLLTSPALKLMMGVGFKREATLRHHYGPGLHAVVSSMIQPEYERSRWPAKPQKPLQHPIQ